MSTTLAAPSFFEPLSPQPADALLALIGLHRDDPRADKIDLGVGVYRDAQGRTPVMRAVKAAERRLIEEQQSKSYLGAEGDARFAELLAELMFGAALARSDRLTGVQTPGGTGALRLGAELIARANPSARVWIGTPTWPNHAPIFATAGLRVESHAYFDAPTSDLDFPGMMAALAEVRPGDVLLVHGCCHNPTGTGFTLDQWRVLAEFCLETGVTPFVDVAYQGMGQGLIEDVEGPRLLLEAVPDALIAYSCNKNFGLYRDRVGTLWAMGPSATAARTIRDNMLVITRSLWSMPPDHGAALVRLILDDPALAADWQAELRGMRERINGVRASLSAMHPRLEPIGRQLGLFAMLPIDAAATATLREAHGIYMPASGRINLAGLREETIPTVVAALRPFLAA